jgi:hypothetical protein
MTEAEMERRGVRGSTFVEVIEDMTPDELCRNFRVFLVPVGWLAEQNVGVVSIDRFIDRRSTEAELLAAVIRGLIPVLQHQADRLSPLQSCTAKIYHGPGHQSGTSCELKGPHEIHEARYGSGDQLARWKGDKIFSGAFDEPPTDPEDAP